MAQPWPPGQEPEVPDAELAWVKPPGGEYARVWNDQLPGHDLGGPGSGIDVPGLPVASFVYTPPSPKTQDTVTFDGSGSTADAPLTLISWNWAFNHGNTTRSGQVVTWRLPSGSGTYDCVLTVTDSAGQSGTATQLITI